MFLADPAQPGAALQRATLLSFGSKGTSILLNWCKDYSTLWHCRTCNLTAESPQISTRRPQTPDKAIGTLCAKCTTQKAFNGFVFIDEKEENQTRV